MSDSLALVLAGGGLAGIAWETGVLLGVQDVAPAAADRLLGAEALLGTSAGATVAAQLCSGVSLTELYDRQLCATSGEIAPAIEFDRLTALFEEAARQHQTPLMQRLALIGRRAVDARTVDEPVRRAVIEGRLPCHQWPRRRLQVTAVDVATGERVVFDRDSDVALVDAVAASAAVPVVWPPVTIGDRRFMDGGIGSSANVDVVADFDVVVMLAPTAAPGLSPFGHTLADELAAHPGRALGVFADEASITAFGANPLDPACRAPSASAGREQGRRQAGDIAAFLARR